MEIEIKHIRPEVEKEKNVLRKELEDKYRDGPNSTHLLSSILIFIVICSNLYLYKIFDSNIIFIFLPILAIIIGYKNMQYARYGQGDNKTLVYILSLISIAGSMLWILGTIALSIFVLIFLTELP